jgi:hypothetical protein
MKVNDNPIYCLAEKMPFAHISRLHSIEVAALLSDPIIVRRLVLENRSG